MADINILQTHHAAADRTADGIPLHEKVVVKARVVLGERHPDAVRARSNLAYLYTSAGRLAEATELLEQVVADSEHIFGHDHPDTLAATGQVSKSRGRYVARSASAVNTSHDPELSRRVKAAWFGTALERLNRNSAGNFGYSLFAVSRKDLQRLRDLHLEYVRAMQELIARSEPVWVELSALRRARRKSCEEALGARTRWARPVCPRLRAGRW